jgi:hypothetical protein
VSWGGFFGCGGGGLDRSLSFFRKRIRLYWGLLGHSLAFTCVFLCWRLLIVERGVFHSCSIATFFASSVICMRGAGYDLLDWVDQQEL